MKENNDLLNNQCKNSTYGGISTIRNSPPDIHLEILPIQEAPVWQDSKCVYLSKYYHDNRLPVISVYQKHEMIRVLLADYGIYDLARSSITYYPGESKPNKVSRYFINGTVLAIYYEWHGLLALHASAVARNAQAVAFLAHSGGGKSTLAARFLASGWSLIADDILPVESKRDSAIAHPNQPFLRVSIDQAKHFIESNPGLELFSDGFKYIIPVGDAGIGAFSSRPVSLTCIYVIERLDEPGTRIEIAPVSPREAVIELVRLSYAPHLANAIGMARQRLENIVTLAQTIPVRRLRYPSGLDHLSGVYRTISTDLKSLV